MRTITQSLLLAALTFFLLPGCAASDGTTDATGTEDVGSQTSCAPDASSTCVCGDGSQGTAICTDGATASCQCNGDDSDVKETSPDAQTEEPASDVHIEKPANICEEPDDCREPGACPEDADLGCACTEIAWGLKMCIPLCERARDCPQDPEAPMECNDEGLCIATEKDGGNPPIFPGEGEGEGEGEQYQPPTPCEDQDDCEDCPYELGCTCYGGNNGNKRCRPNCNTDDDCPEMPNGNAICNDDNVCVRDQPDGGGRGGGGNQGGGD